MTPLFNETVFQLFHVVNPALVETLLQHTRGGWLNSLQSTIQFHGTSQQLEVIPSNSSISSRP